MIKKDNWVPLFSDEENIFFDRVERLHLEDMERAMREFGYSDEEIKKMRKENG